MLMDTCLIWKPAQVRGDPGPALCPIAPHPLPDTRRYQSRLLLPPSIRQSARSGDGSARGRSVAKEGTALLANWQASQHPFGKR